MTTRFPSVDISMAHPDTGEPTTGTSVDYFMRAGRYVGFVVEFGEGDRRKMTFEEIRQLQDAVMEKAYESV